VTNFPLIPLGQLGKVSWGNTSITKASYVSSGFTTYSATGPDGFLPNAEHKGEGIVLSAIGAKCGKCFYANGEWTAIKNTITITENKPYTVDFRYLFHYLNRDGVWPVRGGGQPFIGLGTAREVKVPLPPLSEQKRIAAILDKADAIRKKRKKAIGLTETFLRSAFLEMFGDPVTNLKGWEKGTIETVVINPKEDIRCGPFGTQLKVHELVPSGIPLWGIENVHHDLFKPDTKKFLTREKAEQLSRFDAGEGDVLVTRMGTIGRACVVPKGAGQGRISYHLFRIRPDRKKCLPEFLTATISRSGTFHTQLKRLAHGAIMDGLSTGMLKEVQFLLPPVPSQKKYVGLVNIVEGKIQHHKAGTEKLETLFSSLTQRAFKGEL